MRLVFLLEEPSMKYLLDELLPKMLPEDVSFLTIPHNGKSDLRKSIPRKLRSWLYPDDRFVVVQDQDNADCILLKHDLQQLCDACRQGVLVRIACQELEAWYFGDLQAVSEAYGKDYRHLATKKNFRVPDQIPDPKKELLRYIPQHQQIQGAQKVGPLMDIERNTSASFRTFVSGVRRLVSESAFT